MKFVQVCIFIVVWATCPSFCSFVSEFLHGILGALEAVGDCHGKLQIQESSYQAKGGPLAPPKFSRRSRFGHPVGLFPSFLDGVGLFL